MKRTPNSKTPFFAVDVGNTRTKIAVWFDVWTSFETFEKSNRTENVAAFGVGISAPPPPDVEFVDASDSFEATEGWLGLLSFGDNVSARWLVSSVNVRKSKALEATVRRSRPSDSFELLKIQDVPIPFEYDYPEKLGLDRVVAAFAGARLLGANRPFLTIDVGTAATIDYVDSEGVFRGGAILPGPRLTAEALRAKTASLPMLDNPESEGSPTLRYPATETQNAIRLGVVFTLIGAVAAFFWTTRRKIAEGGGDPARLALIVAGGDATATERNLRTHFDDLDANLSCAGFAAVPRPEIVVEPRLLTFGLWEIERRKSVQGGATSKNRGY